MYADAFFHAPQAVPKPSRYVHHHSLPQASDTSFSTAPSVQDLGALGRALGLVQFDKLSQSSSPSTTSTTGKASPPAS